MARGLAMSLFFWVPFIWLWCCGYFFYGLGLGFLLMILFMLYLFCRTSPYVEGTLKKAHTLNLVDCFKKERRK